MRVLHLRNSDLLGGPERLLLNQCALASPGFDMCIVSFETRGAPNPLLEEARARGIETLALHQRNNYDPFQIGRLKDLLRAYEPDVVVGHDYKANLLLHAARNATSALRAAVVHGYTRENRKIRLFEAAERRVLRRVDAVIAVSRSTADMLVEHGIDLTRVHVVPNAIDVEAVAQAAEAGRAGVRSELGVDDATFVWLALGRLSPEKGQDVLLQAFTDVPNAHLALVGDGALRASLEADASERTHFLGWRSDPWACLGAADGFVLPSRSEGLPLALLEAMAARRPIVATRVGGVADVLDEGTCGRLVASEDAAGLAAAMRATVENAAVTTAHVEAAAQRVRDVYGAERQARALEDVYASL